MEYILTHGDINLPYTIITSARRKTMAITIDRNRGITLCIPRYVPLQEGIDWIEQKKEWIIHKVHKYNIHNVDTSQALDYIQFLGVLYPIEIHVSGKNRITLQEGSLVVYTHTPIQSYIRNIIVKWLRKQANIVFRREYEYCLQYFHHFCEYSLPDNQVWYGKYTYLFSKALYPRLRIYTMKRKFGSLKQDATLTISTHLIHAPIACIRLVFFHELVHIVEFSHSKRFYQLLTALYPSWREYEAWLHKELRIF